MLCMVKVFLANSVILFHLLSHILRKHYHMLAQLLDNMLKAGALIQILLMLLQVHWVTVALLMVEENIDINAKFILGKFYN